MVAQAKRRINGRGQTGRDVCGGWLAAKIAAQSAQPQPGEYVAARLEVGDGAGATVAQVIQHNEGFAAHIAGHAFEGFRPAAWQQGWLDAAELGEFAPTEFFRMNAEA
jgi:hypothetical protein